MYSILFALVANWKSKDHHWHCLWNGLNHCLMKLRGYLTGIISSNLEKQHMTKDLFLISESQKPRMKDSISKITK